MDEQELEQFKEDMLESLSPVCRQAYQLVREQGMSYVEAARLLGVSRGGISAFVVKAQAAMRRKLKRRGIGTEAWSGSRA